jgi:hypothetical protein
LFAPWYGIRERLVKAARGGGKETPSARVMK